MNFLIQFYGTIKKIGATNCVAAVAAREYAWR
jgi:hypothetical protein